MTASLRGARDGLRGVLALLALPLVAGKALAPHGVARREVRSSTQGFSSHLFFLTLGAGSFTSHPKLSMVHGVPTVESGV